MRNDVIEHIGSCIWEARRHKGYSRRVLSEKTGLSERTIEKGKVNTTAETLYTLINALDMSADYLFKMDKHQADVKCEQVINMLMACDENQKDVVCRTMQTLIEADARGEKSMSIQDRNQWIHECFAENYDILVVRAKRRAGNDPILRNEIEDCVIEAFEMAWSKYGQLKHHPCILGWLTQTVYNKIDNLRMRASTKMSRQAADIDDPAVMQIEDKRAQKRSRRMV